MAKGSTNNSMRLPIEALVMRKLMFTSGGYCAMTDCRQPLIGASGGWIGTVSHIYAAEDGGPRGNKHLSAEERRDFKNLILFCATHGREVDDRKYGEIKFPAEKLLRIKEEHEAKVEEAVVQAIEREQGGPQNTNLMLDLSRRTSESATTGIGLLESFGHSLDSLDMARFQPRLIRELEIAERKLTEMSQVALEVLSGFLELWMREKVSGNEWRFDFPDYTTDRLELDNSLLVTKIRAAGRSRFDNAVSELQAREIVEFVSDEDGASWTVKAIWGYNESSATNRGRYDSTYNFLLAAAQFLWYAFEIPVYDWVKGLNFGLFDTVAGEEKTVPWRWAP
ncbi:hypothetical protein AB0J72_45285 [Dactylosporangium sp. NPDC049742]|uniref:hypothetical protein n=1 Tax=Dactylosporangium sp. NPDC049742 TaxID=3154737 RepID=UPI003425B8D6